METVKEKQVKAEELRLGNLLLNPYSNEPEVVDRITRVDALNAKYAINEEAPVFFRPIPLNEEWLLKFGFKKMIEGYCEMQLQDCFTLIEGDKNGYLEVFVLDYDWIRVQYVHQLQNLYFALTGEELTLKDSPPYKTIK